MNQPSTFIFRSRPMDEIGIAALPSTVRGVL
jgi:hypothetical protein